MVALDQMDGGRLDAKATAELLGSTEPALKETASWIVGRHPEWAGALAGVLGERLARADLPAAERAELERQLGRFAEAAPIQRLLAAAAATSPSATAPERLSCLAAMSRSGLKPGRVPREWVDALATALGDDPAVNADAALISAAVATARSLPIARNADGARPLSTRLLAIAADSANPIGLRLDALAAVPGGLDQARFHAVRLPDRPDRRDRPVAARTTAADVLAQARLSPEQLDRLADVLSAAGPVEVDRLLTAFEQSTDESLGLKLVSVLARSPVLSSLRIDALKAHLAKYGPAVRSQRRGASLLPVECQRGPAEGAARADDGHPGGRRYPPGPARLPQREGRVLLLPRHRLSRRERRPRPHAGSARSDPIATSWRPSSSPAPAWCAASSRSPSPPGTARSTTD